MALPVGVRLAVGRGTPGPVGDPDPGMLDPVSPGSTEHLPRIAPDGRAPMQAYAAGFDPDRRRPRAALLLAGIGMNAAESDVAIRTLPGRGVARGVALCDRCDEAADDRSHRRGHEYLIALPLEPSGYPLSDPGPETLLTTCGVAGKRDDVAVGVVADRWLCRRDRRDRHDAGRAVGPDAGADGRGAVRNSRHGACFTSTRAREPARCRKPGAAMSTG